MTTIERYSLRTARRIKEISQDEMAEKLGIHRNTYASWEEHPEDISMKNASIISEILGMPVEKLIFYADDSTKCRVSGNKIDAEDYK
ncbi:MAG: helix-turn-helix transcriptional regulator [Solobacterium sp.]|nr:helix-turn-helix transcriptional regulator [Solobacterium sp.]